SLENTTMSRPRSAVLARTGPRLVSTLASACWLRAIRLSMGSSSGPPGPHGVSRCIGVCRRSGKHLQPSAHVHAGTRFVSELLGRTTGDGCARTHVLHHHRVGPDGGEVANGDWTQIFRACPNSNVVADHRRAFQPRSPADGDLLGDQAVPSN